MSEAAGAALGKMTDKVRVLFVDHAEGLGGAEHSLLLLLKHLDRQRFVPLLACNPGHLADRALAVDVGVRVVPMPRLRNAATSVVRWPRGVVSLVRLARRESVDVVYSNVLRASLYAAPAAQLARLPLVWQLRDILPRGLYIRWMSRRASEIIAVSRAAAEPLAQGLPVTVIPNGVDLDSWRDSAASRAKTRARWGWPEQSCVIGIVGRLRPQKGQEHFLRAMARLADEFPGARFAVVGGTPLGSEDAYRERLHALSEQLRLAERVTFTGHRSDVQDLLHSLDVLVVSSTMPESFGRVVIEGMAAGLPVVAYDHGGPSEIVVDGATGCLVPPGDIAGLGSAVARLVGDAKTRSRMGAAGRERVASRYDVRDVARETERVLARAADAVRKA